MTYLQAALLGILQGLTEFLPVSSSGHLALAQGMWGLEAGDLLFEVTVHLATLLAVVAYYRKDIVAITRGVLTGKPVLWQDMSPRRWALIIIVASVPAAVVGLGFKEALEASFGDLWGVAMHLLATGALLFSTAALLATRRKVGGGSALAVGVAQAIAILPGISRSGATIATAIWFGIDREQAARFSFLLSIPAVAGAFILEAGPGLKSLATLEAATIGPLLIGFVAALVSGYIAVAVLIRALARHRFAYFGIWCWAVGLSALWWLRA
jgi:undecaprenyl-diphosphatase